MARLKLKSHAKINLLLEVLYRRRDGYHQLRTILQELELHDTLYLEEIPGGRLELLCDDPSLPSGKGNLAFRAAQLMQSTFAAGRGARIRLKKRIPIAAGLGGGSSNAAAVLKGLNRLWGLFLPDNDLGMLGAQLGSDVPFFISGGTALAGGRGEIIQPLPPFPRTKVLLAAVRGARLSAAEVYGALDLEKISPVTKIEQFICLLEATAGGARAGAAAIAGTGTSANTGASTGTRADTGAGAETDACAPAERGAAKIAGTGAGAGIDAGMGAGAGAGAPPGKDLFNALASLMQNHLEAPVFSLHKDTASLKDKFLRKGLAAMVSGSGPTLFVLSRDDQLLYKLEKELPREGCWGILTETMAGKGDIIELEEKRGG